MSGFVFEGEEQKLSETDFGKQDGSIAGNVHADNMTVL